MEKLPIYELVVDEASESMGVSAIALVDMPAIGVNWQAFSTQKRFEVQNQEERVIMGAAMIPDLPILRLSADGTPYHVIFKKDTVKTLARKFMREGRFREFNMMHDSEAKANGVFIFETWLVDRERGKMPPKGFENIADGSWFISAKVDDDVMWNKIKSGDFAGFSIEGYFDDLELDKMHKTSMSNKVEALLNGLKELFNGEAETKMGEAMTIDGTPVKWEGETLEIGAAFKTVTDKGEMSAPDGEYELQDGKIVTTKGGMVEKLSEVGNEFNAETFLKEFAKTHAEGLAKMKAELSAELNTRIEKIEEGIKKAVEKAEMRGEERPKADSGSPDYSKYGAMVDKIKRELK